jgi:predicted DNA-binding ribbon-helix-helix protein
MARPIWRIDKGRAIALARGLRSRSRRISSRGSTWVMPTHLAEHSLQEIAHTRKMKVSDLIGEIDAQPRQGNLSSALRLYVLRFYRSQIPDTADSEGVAG